MLRCRRAQVLLAIMQAGTQVEEMIAHHAAEIDGGMLQLLVRRMKAAEQLEAGDDVLQGLQLLYRRLKAEVDRQQAPPALHLLDEVMAILSPADGGLRCMRSARGGTSHLDKHQLAAHCRSAWWNDAGEG